MTGNRSAIIYGLVNEHGHQVLYVGKTIHPVGRYKAHVRDGIGFTIGGMAILERVPPSGDADRAERQWIKWFGRENLYNQTNGGNGAWVHPPSLATLKKMSAAHKKQWENPEIRSRNIKAICEAAADPSYRKKLSEVMKQSWDKPGRRERQSKAQLKLWKKPSYRKKMEKVLHGEEVEAKRKRTLQQRRADPSYRDKVSEIGRSLWATPSYREAMEKVRQTKNSKAMRKVWSDPKYKKRSTAAIRAGWAKSLKRLAAAKRMKELWNDPVYRKRMEAVLRRSNQARKLA